MSPGHEIIGRVVAVGPKVEDWKVGDRVGGAWYGIRIRVLFAANTCFLGMEDMMVAFKYKLCL